MQEYTVKYEGFQSGLRPSWQGRRQQAFLLECLNVQPFQESVTSIQPIISPVPQQEVIFPFPQLVIANEIFQLNASSVQRLSGNFQPIASMNVTSGDSWQWADFGKFVLFANGQTVVQYREGEGFLPWTGPKFSTCCSFNGQLVVGGFAPSWYDAGLNSVGWSKIGSADFTIDKSNTAGYAHVDGDVLCVKQLGKGFLAYSDRSVNFFSPVAEPVVTFAQQSLENIPGIASRNAVGGNSTKHLLVDSVGQLWLLTNEAPKMLGYQDFLSRMLGTDIIVTYNEATQNFSISNEEVSFVWNERGMAKHYQAITSQSVFAGGAIGFFEAVDDQGFLLKTDSLDFGFRGLKTLTSVELAHSSNAYVYVALDWRYDTKEPFRSSRWVRLNERGIATLMVTAADFRVKLQSSDYRNMELDYALLKFKISDKRNIRGGHASQTSS